MTGMTRGRLPARVYWVRRLALLGVAALLVVGLAQLLGPGGGSSGDRAAPAADTSAPTSGSTGPLDGVSPGATHTRAHHHATALPAPSGPCSADDVTVEPSVPHPVAGGDIKLVLRLSTVTSPACDWQLSARTLALTITSGSDLIWTSAQCPRAIAKQSMVLRSATQAKVSLTWDARRSAPGCRQATDWALPGTYHLHAAALAGQPQQATFLLTAPSPPQVTRTAHPDTRARQAQRRHRRHLRHLRHERHLRRLLHPHGG